MHECLLVLLYHGSGFVNADAAVRRAKRDRTRCSVIELPNDVGIQAWTSCFSRHGSANRFCFQIRSNSGAVSTSSKPHSKPEAKAIIPATA